MWEILIIILSVLFFTALFIGMWAGFTDGFNPSYHPDPVWDEWADLMSEGKMDLTFEEFKAEDAARTRKWETENAEKKTDKSMGEMALHDVIKDALDSTIFEEAGVHSPDEYPIVAKEEFPYYLLDFLKHLRDNGPDIVMKSKPHLFGGFYWGIIKSFLNHVITRLEESSK